MERKKKLSKKIQLNLTESQEKKLAEIIERTGLNLSELIRRIIDNYLDNK